MRFFSNKKPTTPKPLIGPMAQREAVARHLATQWVNNMSSADTDKRMKEAGYEPMDLGGRKFNSELQVNPFYKRGQIQKEKRPEKCPGCGAPTERKSKCNYCGSVFPW